MQLPAHQDGFQNRDKVYYLLTIINSWWREKAIRINEMITQRKNCFDLFTNYLNLIFYESV